MGSGKADDGRSTGEQGLAHRSGEASTQNQQEREQDSSSRLQIVGIGASAGGLAALKAFFKQVPDDSGLAYVVVVHLSPEHKSHLAELLQPHVAMPVQQVTATVKLEPNRVYVIPPNANLDTIDTHLRLTELEKRRQERAPVDHFFRTLAKAHDGDSIGVILTGTGSDGTLGLREIKERGGLTVVQDPADAEYDGMPQSAISTGLVDLVLPVAKIPQAIIDYSRTVPRVPVPAEDEEVEATLRQLLQKVFAQLRARTGRDFSRYKRSTIMRRIQRRMQLRRVEELSSYLELLREEPDETRVLADDLLVTVTNFFRDPEVFESLEQDVIPRLFDGLRQSVRVWSVGCATGEEAYSLAILLIEEATRRNASVDLQVFASDLHQRSLKTARDAFYPGDIETDVTPERLRRFFHKEDGGYRVRKEVRDLVVFAPHNLLNDPPFSRMDLIACRNLLIYLQRDVQQEVVELFHYALNPDGFLVLGTSETMTASELFRVEDKKCCVYRKRNVPVPEPRLPVFPLSRTRLPEELRPHEQTATPIAYGLLHQQMLEQFAPPSLLVSPDDRVVHLSDHAGRYLVLPGGELTASVFKLVREELRLELRAALHSVRDRGERLTTRPIEVRFNGDTAPVTLHVRPAAQSLQQGFALVIFEEHGAEGASSAAAPAAQLGGNADPAPDDRQLESLRAELSTSQQRQQSIIEEYETSQEELRVSNEELQSANEELRSTLEELETSKEELQSMNEELQTVNQENRHKVEELAQLSSDLQNLMAATEIATLFLDRDLRILRFTPQVSELFNVRMTDRGRPLSDLTHRLGYDKLHEDARCVLQRLVPVIREVQDDEGRWYLCRVLPYRSTADRIEGIVITLVDITQRVSAEAAVRESEERFRALVAASAQMVWTTDAEGRAVDDSPSWRAFTGQSYDQWKDSGWLDAIHPDDRPGAEEGWRRAVREREPLVNEFRVYHAPSGRYSWTTVRAVPLFAEAGTVRGWVGMNIDITPQKESEEALREADRRKNEFLAMLAHELRNPLAPIRTGLELMKVSMDDPAALDEIRNTIERQTDQLISLVDDLLDISRITRGTFRLRRRVVPLDEIVQSAVEASHPLIEGAGHELNIEIPHQRVFIEGDPNRLAQVLANLLNNAARYTPHGGRIWLSAEPRGNEVLFTVRDTGAGIPPERVGQIFEMFSQPDHSESEETGLGVGLTLAKQLVEMHGGKIEVSSEGAGKGSEFRVRLPAATASAMFETPSAPEESPEIRQGLRVLIADDNADAAKMLSKLVTALGGEVRTAEDGQQAVEAVEEFRPHVVLMDLGMPRMDGYEAAKRIRQQSWARDTMLVALTGWGQDEDRRRTAEAGFDHHLVKPVGRDALISVLAQKADAST